MTRLTPPIRFVASILIVWIGLRIAFWSSADVQLPAPDQTNPLFPDLPDFPVTEYMAPAETRSIGAVTQARPNMVRHPSPSAMAYRPSPAPPLPSQTGTETSAAIPNEPAMRRGAQAQPFSQAPEPDPSSTSRSPFSLSAWVQWRSGDGIDALARDGELGGSQAGVRGRYRLVRAAGLEAALSVRVSHPLEREDGGEAAIGISIRPSGHVPVELIAERRIALDEGGRNAWSLGIAGGVNRRPLPLDFEFDGYAQAGIVGADSRDLYGDAALAVSRPIPIDSRNTVSLGAGIWAGAQPGVSRVDIGPEASIRLPAGGGGIRVSASWRERIAGSAAPGSGPVLTVGADF